MFAFFWEICKLCLREDDFLVDLEKCCKMRIWTRKSALIQPRTSFGKSEALSMLEEPVLAGEAPSGAPAAGNGLRRWLRRWRQGWLQGWPRSSHHSFWRSFSAVSTPIFASKVSFFCIFRNLQNYLVELSEFARNLQNFWKFTEIFVNFRKFCKCSQILQNSSEFRWVFIKIY